MLNRKLLEVLGRLGPAEKKQLRLFLVSPYFNRASNAEDIVRLYDLIVKYDANEEHPALSKKAVFVLFFPERQFKEKEKGPLDSLTSEIFRLIRRFLGQIELEKENLEINDYLALSRFYRKFGFEERFEQTMSVLRRIQQNTPLRDSKYFFDQFKIEEEESAFRSLNNSFVDDINLLAAHKNLDLFYSIQKMDLTCLLEFQKRLTSISDYPTSPLFDSILSLIHNEGPLNIPINHLYYLAIRQFNDSASDSDLIEFDSLLRKYKEEISDEKYQNLQAFSRFFWTLRYQKAGDGMSLHNNFDIYRRHLSEGYFYIDNLIPHTTFRNLVIFGLKLGEYDWVKNFLDTHPPERIGSTRYPAEIHSLNYAEYYFYLKKYDEALEHLVYKLFENPTVSILADVLLIKIYYETQNDLLETRMKALDQKVRRSKLGKEVKNRYLTFLRKLDKIIKYGWQKKSPRRLQLIDEIKSAPEIIAREWLLEQLG
jgi:hypothetical protein